MTHWAMVTDLRKCIGCETCKHVCDDANYVPPGATWRRMVNFKKEGDPRGDQVSMTMGCMHCQEPPCLDVCPSGATYRRPDGIVDINHELCVGCGACIVACPYKARSITFEDKILALEENKQKNTSGKKVDKIGVCSKCDFCLARLDKGLELGLKPGQDSEATPMCVRFCVADALIFGDLDDPDSEVSKLIRENRTSRLNEELQTDPSVYYIVG